MAQYRLYQLYSKAMLNISFRMLGNIEDAEDLLQNAFIDVFTKLDHFRFESSIGAWIKRIVINKSINHLKKKRLSWVSLEDRDVPDEQAEERDWDTAKLDIARINAAIPKLPDGYRVVLSLYLLEGFDHQEIADVLGVSTSTSKSQYNRAKKKLRALLEASDNQNQIPWGN